jgi:hypothetical protein
MIAAAAIIASFLAATGLLVWLELRNRRGWRRIEAQLDAIIAGPSAQLDAIMAGLSARLDAMAARLDLIDARLAAGDAKRNGGDRVAADHPRLIEMRQ